MLDLADTQGHINQWQRETFPTATALSTFAHFRREVRELGREMGDDTHSPQTRSELADLFIVLVQLCDKCGVDLEMAVIDKMAVNLQRKWQAPDAEGVVEHVRDGPA